MYPTTTGITGHEGDDKPEGKPAAEIEKWGGVEKLLYARCPELSSQILEGGFHLYKGRLLSDLEQFGGESNPSLYDQTQERKQSKIGS